MSIFISYFQQDKFFVQHLLTQLQHWNHKAHVEPWELSANDSLIGRLRDAGDGAGALLLVLSRASAASDWGRELSPALLQELAARNMVVVPLVLESGDRPFLAQGAAVADFRQDFDTGFGALVDVIARVATPSLGRIRHAAYRIDWSIDWRDVGGQAAVLLHYIHLFDDLPFTCLTQIDIVANSIATRLFAKNRRSLGEDRAKLHVLALLSSKLNAGSELKLRLPDEKEQVFRFSLTGPLPSESYTVRVGARRLGEDSGRDVLLNTSVVLRDSCRHMQAVLGPAPR